MMDPTPLRPDEQVAGGFIAMPLGGQSHSVKVLPMALSRKWLASAKEQIGSLRGTADMLDSFEDIADFIAGQSEMMLDLLIAYDELGDKVLPDREWLDAHATDRECYDGWKRVTAATSPLAEEALRIVPDLIPILIEAFRKAVSVGTARAVAIHLSRPTNGSQPSTAGAPTTSSPTSPTSSSPSSAKSSRNGASAKRSSS